MSATQYDIGDMVFAAEDILNDGGMPGIDEEEGLIAPAGARGVVVHFGHSEVDPSREIYLVRFETGAPELAWMNKVIAIGVGQRPPSGPTSRRASTRSSPSRACRSPSGPR